MIRESLLKNPKFGYIKLKLTNRCNLDCSMCGIPRNYQREMDTKQLKLLIDEVKSMNGVRMHTTGGEPTIRDDLIELIKYSTKKGLPFDIQTNGTLITREYAKKLLDAGLAKVAITLQGPKDIDEILRGKGSYDKTVGAIKYLVKNKIPEIGLVAAITKVNFRHLNALIKFVHGLGIENIAFQPYFRTRYAPEALESLLIKGKDVEILEAEIEKMIKTANDLDINIGNEIYLRTISDYFRKEYFKNNTATYPDKDCLFPFKCCVVYCNGDVYPCYKMTRKEDYIGNVIETPLSKLWVSEKFYKARESIREGNCPGCLLSCYAKKH